MTYFFCFCFLQAHWNQDQRLKCRDPFIFLRDKRLNQYSSNTSASLFHCKDFARLNECKWIYSVLTEFMVIYLKNRPKKTFHCNITKMFNFAIKIKSYLFNSQLRSISVNDAVLLWHTRLRRSDKDLSLNRREKLNSSVQTVFLFTIIRTFLVMEIRIHSKYIYTNSTY